MGSHTAASTKYYWDSNYRNTTLNPCVYDHRSSYYGSCAWYRKKFMSSFFGNWKRIYTLCIDSPYAMIDYLNVIWSIYYPRNYSWSILDVYQYRFFGQKIILPSSNERKSTYRQMKTTKNIMNGNRAYA